MGNKFWMCWFCRENDKTDINHSSETKFFQRYVDNIVRTVKNDTKELLDSVNDLHPNLQFTEHENWHWKISLEMKFQLGTKSRYETTISTLQLIKTKVSLR